MFNKTIIGAGLSKAPILPIYNLSLSDGSNTISNDIILSFDSASYDGTKRTSVNSNYTDYTVGTSVGMEGATTSIIIDTEITSFDSTNTVWFVNDRATTMTGRFQLLYDNGSQEITLMVFSNETNFVKFSLNYTISLSTRIKIEYVYDDVLETATMFIDDVSQSVIKSVTGTYTGIQGGTSGTLVIGGRGWSLSNASLIGSVYKCTIEQV